MRTLGYGVLLAVLIASPALAQPGADGDPLSEGIAAYNASDYPLALEKLNAAASQAGRYTDKQFAECHRYLGMTYVAFDTSEEARKQFLRALEYDPTLDFNPDITSPKILSAFEQARATHLLMKGAGAKARPGPAGPAAAPADRRRTVAGWTLIGVGGTSALASATFYGLMWDRASKYDAEDESKSRADRLKSEGLAYRDVSAATAGVAIVTAGVGTWLLLTRDRSVHAGVPGFSVLPGPGAGVTLCVHFR